MDKIVVHEAYSRYSEHNLHCLNSYPKNASTESFSCYSYLAGVRVVCYGVYEGPVKRKDFGVECQADTVCYFIRSYCPDRYVILNEWIGVHRRME
ncbi:hypothetical protein D3C74_07900 [compost metagenome]